MRREAEIQQRRTGGIVNRRETSGCRQKKVDAGAYIKLPP
jgi:hypothetical protein